MLKVVCVVDKTGTALDRLAKGVIPYNTNLDYVVVDVHPKRPDDEQLARFTAAAETADIIDFQYFRTAEMLIERFPWLKSKGLILTHNNPYSIRDGDWKDYDILVANNKEIQANLKDFTKRDVEHIPITTDPLFWEYRREFKPNKNVIMVANRIEAKKGILPVAIACGEAGLSLTLVGAISDRNYFHSVLQTGCVTFYEQISDEKLLELYHSATVHVCNSVDNFESGTMPILEAMQSGTPVMTRNIGHVPDLYNGENLEIYTGDNDDVLAIKEQLENLILDRKKLEAMRSSAWNTAKNFNFERRAYLYQKLYRRLQAPGDPVSVIVPIFEGPEVIRKCLSAIAAQTYKNIEIVVCDDNPDSNKELIDDFAKMVACPVRYINSSHIGNDYGLARARNMGVIEATSDIVVFCDQRQIMEPNAVEELVKNLVPKTWVYGDKGGKKDFVENFSACYRGELIRAGLFSERMDAYGGMSQEIRSRTRMQGIRHQFIPEAKATPAGKSSKKHTEKPNIIRMKNRLYKMEL